MGAGMGISLRVMGDCGFGISTSCRTCDSIFLRHFPGGSSAGKVLPSSLDRRSVTSLPNTRNTASPQSCFGTWPICLIQNDRALRNIPEISLNDRSLILNQKIVSKLACGRAEAASGSARLLCAFDLVASPNRYNGTGITTLPDRSYLPWKTFEGKEIPLIEL